MNIIAWRAIKCLVIWREPCPTRLKPVRAAGQPNRLNSFRRLRQGRPRRLLKPAIRVKPRRFAPLLVGAVAVGVLVSIEQ